MVGSVAMAALLLLAPQQSAPKFKHDSSNPTTCKTCSKALTKAYTYIEKTRQEGWTASFLKFFPGMLYLADGKHPKKLQRIVDHFSRFYRAKSFNENWGTCMGALFLSEVYRRHPTEKLKATLAGVLKVAEMRMESTGGWGHNLGHAAESGYDKRGGAVDLGILTAMMYSAMLNMKESGIRVSSKLLAKVERNLEKNFDSMGITYGTGNKWGDIAMGRGGWAWLGIHSAKRTQTKLFKSIPKGLKARYKDTHTGHSHPPLHFMGVAIANHLVGSDSYKRWFSYWGDRLIAAQKADGSVKLPHSENKKFQESDKLVSSTATFALILLLQQKNLFKKGVSGGSSGGGGIFGNRTKKSSATPWMGVRIGSDALGPSIRSVVAKSPAAKAGFQEGDLILKFGGRDVKDSAELGKMLSGVKLKATVKVTILRGGEQHVLGVTPSEKPSSSLGTKAVKPDEY